MKQCQVGLAVGRGTGGELATIFETVIGKLANQQKKSIKIVKSPRVYHSYHSLKSIKDPELVRRATQEDSKHYEDFCRDQARSGTTAIFRTAMNAQSLYLVRERMQAVKVDMLGEEKEILHIRDESQGFYTGENTHQEGKVIRKMEFSKQITEKIIRYAIERARKEWPKRELGPVIMAYKYHLLDRALEDWVTEISNKLQQDIKLLQPDTVNRNLIMYGWRPGTIIISGNEWGDIMHVILLDRFGCQRQENECTENVFLDPLVSGLVEYQTVHGSADELQDKDIVNPFATFRAAAVIAEKHANCDGSILMMEQAIESLIQKKIVTQDLGGKSSTSVVVKSLIQDYLS